jgi:hypothetical protein
LASRRRPDVAVEWPVRPSSHLRQKEACDYNVRRSNHENEAAVQMLRADPKRFAQLITHRPSMEDAGRAFEMLETGEGRAAKIVVQV